MAKENLALFSTFIDHSVALSSPTFLTEFLDHYFFILQGDFYEPVALISITL